MSEPTAPGAPAPDHSVPSPSAPSPFVAHPHTAAPQRAVPARNGLAVAAVVVGVVAILAGVVSQFAPFLILSSDIPNATVAFRLVAVITSVLVLVFAVTALILGLVAARRPVGRVVAGIAIGIGTASAAGVLFGLAFSGVTSLL